MKPSHILAVLTGSVLGIGLQSAGAQTAFDGPASGYAFDASAHAVRAVLGVPGAAWLAPALPGPAWDFLSVAPDGKRGVGIAGASIDLIPDLSQPANFTALGPVRGQVDRIAWSSDSTVAALWSPRSRELRRITGLDATPTVHDPIDLTILGEVVSGWSLSPDGRSVAISAPGSGGASLYLSEADAAPVPLASIAGAGPIVFAPDGASLFVSSASGFGAAGQNILRLDARTGAVTASLDATSFHASPPAAKGPGARGAFRPVNQTVRIEDLSASPDGSRLYAMAGQTLCGYDLASGTPLCQELEVTPSSFERMAGGALLLSYYRTGAMPLWLLDPRTGQIYFVPSGISTDNASN
ncbi:MAG TPA: hypothetical protein VG297_21420 [Bryobacteraceae bacterium]|nr:hypothetical protein [Bryobacteraceae bacterium]